MSQPNEQAELNTLDGERGIPSVNERPRSSGAKALFLIVAACVLLAAVALVGLTFKSEQTAKKEREMESSSVPTRTFTEPPALPQEVEAKPTTVTAERAQPTESRPSLPGDETEEKKAATLDKSASSLMVIAGPKASQNSQTDESEPSERARQNGQDGPLSALLTGTQTDPRKATMLRNRHYLLAKGSFIDCGLQTRLDSTVPGMTTCVVTRDIFGDTGKVKLIERGSTVTGEYQANMRQGMARIYVLWTRIKTPHGVVVNLDSPGADPLGGAGLPGYVDTHFWQRFGGALMLSLIDDVARFVTENQEGADSGNSQINFNSTGEAATDMASVALENTINIPPTLYKNQGERVGIYIARDLDFSGVYDVESK